ncbi:Desert hedgehog protein A [Trichinella pseudospiralis]|uniref:Hedgehog protein n=1 Tax=Trichinella pseudospiralis TaxID=6337 RepID=A0A0V0XTP4_TRIPS|nr:Desert hedgehog protein A [Trichinella pseudospiralis]
MYTYVCVYMYMESEVVRREVSVKASRKWQPCAGYVVLLVWAICMRSCCQGCAPGSRMAGVVYKKHYPLVYNERFPNEPENAPGSAGAAELRIRRSDPGFKRLVQNNNPDIIFRDEENTGADRMMTYRCKQKLDMLAILTMNYWPNVKLRVIDAWYEQNRYSRSALHYEGRAVDITTSDRDRNKLGMLARLAIQAGFDWVYYESHLHVHASVQPDSVFRTKRMLNCFSGSSTVLTVENRRKRMDELEIGDRVLARKTDGKLTFSPVILFLHRDEQAYAKFKTVHISNGTVLTISPDHLIYKANNIIHNGGNAAGAMETIFAADLLPGDQVFVRNGLFDVSQATVLRIGEIQRQGLYAPLTLEGNVFVDDVLASNYAGTSYETLAHVSMAPARFCWTVASKILKLDHTTTTSTDHVHWYARWLWTLADNVSTFVGLLDYIPRL